MEFTDYYQVLGVPRTAEAAAIKAAYRKLARRLHPDVSRDAGAEARFKRVNEAYEVLKDPAKRAKYDRLGANWEELSRAEEFARRHGAPAGGPAASRGGAAGGGAGFSDFFETFFGGGGGGGGRLDVDELLRQARASRAAGGSRTFHFFQGSRGGPGDLDPGAGAATGSRRGRDLEEPVGVSLEEAARGAVRLLRIGARQVEVRIPPGVADGSRVRVGGEGGRGTGGSPPGDLFLRVRLEPHPRFAVQGRDLLAELPVRDDQAVLGARLTLPALTGDLAVTVPPRTRAGARLRLRGKGLPGVGDAAAGDLILTVRVVVPEKPGAAELEHYEALARLRGDAGESGARSTAERRTHPDPA